MKCPICGSRLYPGADRCPDCGCHVRAYAAPVEEALPRRERKNWGRLILTIASILPVLAIIVFTTLISFTARSEREVAVTAPAQEQVTSRPAVRETIPDLEANEDCFAMVSGKLTFLPDRWDGGPVLRIPETVDGRTVTILAPGCFADCTELTTIILPKTLQQIGPKAFSGCSQLRGLYIPEQTTTLGRDAFAGCLELEAVYIPSTMRSIAQDCFIDCAGLLYIFYNGSFEDWNALYADYINPFTAAICLDGTYYHGTGR